MKRLCMLMLLALACLLAAGAFADTEGVIVQSSCSIAKSGDSYLVYCFAQVHNASQEAIALDSGRMILNSGDYIAADKRVSQMWPYYLAPGEDGYLFDVISFDPTEDGPAQMPSLTNLVYDNEYMTVDAAHAGQALPADAFIDVRSRGSATIHCEIHNATQTEAYDVTLAVGVYTEAGQLIYADGKTLTDVGIPAGGRVLTRFDVDPLLVQQWISYGAAPANVVAVAMVRSGED